MCKIDKETENKLLDTVRRAGRIMTRADGIEGVTSEKGDSANLVTKYDIAVQEFLIAELSSLFPDAFFFAEEKENQREDLMREHCFVIDPIDGTANFVHGFGRSAVSVAMFSRAEAVFASVYDPYLDELFSATKGGGAYLNGTPISVSSRDLPHAVVAFGTSPYKKELAEKTFRTAYKFFKSCSDVRRAGSAALDLAYLAAGRVDIFFEYSLSPWDIAAGVLLITEAGGVLCDINGDTPDMSKPTSLIAASPSLLPLAARIAKEG